MEWSMCFADTDVVLFVRTNVAGLLEKQNDIVDKKDTKGGCTIPSPIYNLRKVCKNVWCEINDGFRMGFRHSIRRMRKD